MLWDLLLVTVSTLLGGPGEVLSRQFCRKEKCHPGLPGFLGQQEASDPEGGEL